MNKKKKLIPKLRFPEFKDEGEWEEKELGRVAKKITERNKDSLVKNVFTNSAIHGIVDQRDYFDKDIADKNNLENYYIVKEGDYVYNPRISNIAPVGPISKNKTNKEGAMSPLYTVFRFDSKNNDFFEYYFKSEHWYNAIRKVSNTGARFDRMSIADSAFTEIPVLFPSPKEQQIIASCLLYLDNLINAHNQKLSLLKVHRKGLVQILFPQETEKVPKYRFNEFKKDGTWIKETVGEVYDFKVTNSFAREYLNYEDGTVKNIHYGDIHTKFNTLFDITKEEVPFVNPDVSIEKIRKESYCNVGDIIFADASEDMNDVGKSIEIVYLNKEKLVSGLHTLLARQKEKKLAIGFGGYLFKSDWVRKQIQKEAQGAKVLGISATRISNVQILYPKNHKEQEAISLCLSSLDEIIKAQENKIEQLKKHKKGLMQGLFP